MKSYENKLNKPVDEYFESELLKAKQAEGIAQQRFNLLATARIGSFLGIFLAAWLWDKIGESWLGLIVIGCVVIF